MEKPANFEIVEKRGYLRPVSFLSIDHAADTVNAAIAFAVATGVREVVADVTALAGFRAPEIYERFWIVNRWAQTARGCVRLAVVACREHIHPEKFGILVAENRGLKGDVFTTEVEAISWLDGLPKVAEDEPPGARSR